MTKQLVLKQVSKHYGGIAALKAVDLVAEGGEVHVLLGENGAGKSTCIKILAGAQRPDSGTMTWDGEELHLANPIQAVKHGITAVFQESSLVPDLTVAQNIWFRREPLSPVGMIRGRSINDMTRKLFDELGIPGIAPSAFVSDLSVGEKQLVEIAKAISTDPSILILDESTSGLSHHQTEWLLETCRTLAAKGVLIFFISHRMSEVRSIADRVTVLRNGSSVGTYEITALTDDEVVTLMLGRNAGQLYPDRVDREPGAELLRCEGLTLGHRLVDVDLTVKAGEIVGVGGLQGQGQVELFQALAGATKVRGDIYVNGEHKKFSSPRDALQSGVGIAFVPEDRKTEGLLLGKSIQMNLTLASLKAVSRFGFVNRRLEARAVSQMMEKLQVSAASPAMPVGALSGGNQQKVVIAKYIETQAKVLLLFDLTRGVDVGTKAEIFRLMQDLASQGYGLLFYSTDLEELVHVCDRVAVMNLGSIVAMLHGSEISDEAILAASVGAEGVSVGE